MRPKDKKYIDDMVRDIKWRNTISGKAARGLIYTKIALCAALVIISDFPSCQAYTESSAQEAIDRAEEMAKNAVGYKEDKGTGYGR